jgi:nucleotide-binding universal stress UspA family protein
VRSHGNATLRGRPLRIVVAVDGSPAADRAVSYTLSLVEGRPGSEIFLVNVQTMETLDVSDISAVMTVEADRRLATTQSRTALHGATELCRKTGARFVARAEVGAAAETIDRVTRELGADQIVMGTRGLGSLGNLFLGSVAAKVVQLADVPVTLVK